MRNGLSHSEATGDGYKVTGGAVAYLNTTWLDQTNTDERADIEIHGNAGGLLNACLTYTYPWNYYVTREAKIRLTLSDVEHMRKVAANDAKLKAAFQKIAPHIEVVVDFP